MSAEPQSCQDSLKLKSYCLEITFVLRKVGLSLASGGGLCPAYKHRTIAYYTLFMLGVLLLFLFVIFRLKGKKGIFFIDLTYNF